MADANNINIVELLIGIKEDVSAIKTDMSNFKETQRTYRDATNKELEAIQANFNRELLELNDQVQKKINNIQTVQNTLVGEVDQLKHLDDKNNAKRWKTAIAFICTSLGSVALAKLPDFILFCTNLRTLGD